MLKYNECYEPTEYQRIPVKFEKWNSQRVQVSRDAQRATGKMRSNQFEQTTLYSSEMVGSRTIKINVRALDERVHSRMWHSSWIEFGIVFGETGFNTSQWLHDNGNALCVWAGGTGWSTRFWCRWELSETKKMQIRSGSVLQMLIDCDNKSIVFAVDRVSLPPIEIHISDLESRRLRAAVAICGQTQLEISDE